MAASNLNQVMTAYRARPFVPGVGLCALTQDDEHMLDRLHASEDAAGGFAELQLDETRGLVFIGDCVKANRYATGQHTREVRAKNPVLCSRQGSKKTG